MPRLRFLICALACALVLTAAATTSRPPRPQHRVALASYTAPAPPTDWSGLERAIADRARSDAWYARVASDAWYREVARQAAERRRSAARTRPTTSGRSGGGDSRACVANNENGGDYGRSSNAEHFGRYQFSRSAWVEFGGNPSTWGSASPEEQDRVFDNAWSQGPAVQRQQWLRWDGC